MTDTEKPFDVQLHNGSKIAFDLEAITEAEYRSLFHTTQSLEEEDAILARVSGVPLDKITQLSKGDYKRLWQGFFKKVRDPLSDPS